MYENRLQEAETVSLPPLVASAYESGFQEVEAISFPPYVPSVYESGLTELENVSLSPRIPDIYEYKLMQPQTNPTSGVITEVLQRVTKEFQAAQSGISPTNGMISEPLQASAMDFQAIQPEVSPMNGVISEWLQEPAINVPAMEHQTQLTQVQKQQIIEGSTAKPNQSAKPTIPETQPKPQTQQQRAQNTPSLWERKLLVDSIRDALIAQLSAGVSRPTNRIF